MAELAGRLGRAADLDVVVDTALEVLDDVLGFHHVHLLLLDERGSWLYTIASRGYEDESIGAEVEVGAAVMAMLAMPGLCGADIDLSAGMVA